MSDWHPCVVKIEKVEHHSDADSLDIVTVLGDYPVITKRGEYKVGDLSYYIPIDSVVPDTQDFYFLCPKAYEKFEENGEIKQRQAGNKYSLGSVPEKYRVIRAKKIRGVYSQGMLFDLGKLYFDLNDTSYGLIEPGASLLDRFPGGLKKMEEEEEDNIPNAKKARGANQEKSPTNFSIPFYDLDGLRKYIDCLGENEEIVLTEKIHGSNFSSCFDGEKLWVKSRNFYKKRDEDDPWWDAALRYNLEEKLSKYPMMVAFAELYGSVKGFRYDCEIVNGVMNSKLAFFDVWDTKKMRYLDYDDFVSMMKDLELPTAPLLYRGKWVGKEEMYKLAEGPTTLGEKHTREGFVLSTTKERFESRLNSRLKIKLVGEGYNLQK